MYVCLLQVTSMGEKEENLTALDPQSEEVNTYLVIYHMLF